MNRRRFENLVVELSVAAGELVPRYALWLRLREFGWDPVTLSQDEVRMFLDEHLDEFLANEDIRIRPRESRRVRKRLLRYDPRHPTSEEVLHRIFDAARPPDS